MNIKPSSSYYKAVKPLNISGTKEGRKNPAKAFSYVHKPNDIQSASKKYYAAVELAKGDKEKSPTVQLIVEEKSTSLAVEATSKAFSAGATAVILRCPSTELSKYRAAIDVAVGSMRLTRAQADSVSFVPAKVKSLAALKEEFKEAEAPKPKKPRATRKKKKKALEAAVPTQPVEEPQTIETPEAKSEEPVNEDDIAKFLNSSNYYESDD